MTVAPISIGATQRLSVHRKSMTMLAIGQRHELVSDQGTSVIERLSRRVLRFTTTGTFTSAAGAEALEQTRLVLAEIGTGFCGFYDWSAMTGYSSADRAVATAFVMQHRHQYRWAVFLTSSTMVSMGVNVANLVLGGILLGTTKRDEFEARLEQVLAQG